MRRTAILLVAGLLCILVSMSGRPKPRRPSAPKPRPVIELIPNPSSAPNHYVTLLIAAGAVR